MQGLKHLSGDAQAAHSHFLQHFHHEPEIFFSPGRINLIGEHIDYNDGYVVPAAINYGLYLAVQPNHTSQCQFYSAEYNELKKTELRGIQATQTWVDYFLGVIQILQEKGHNLGGVDLAITGNLPVGKGLSSSAAVECGFIYALNHLFKLNLDKKTMALYGQKAEHEFTGVKCGIMDQFVNIHGEEGSFLFLDCNTLDYQVLPRLSSDYEVILIDSGVRHGKDGLASSEYNLRLEQCRIALSFIKEHLGASSFRNVALSALENLQPKMPALLYQRAHYVVSEIERTRKAKEALIAKDMQTLGQLLFTTHQGLKDDYEVSCQELDALVELAKGEPAILGARMVGGGFGGCSLNLVKKQGGLLACERVAEAYSKKYRPAEILVCGLAQGTHRLF